MIKFHCPGCQQKLGVPDNYAGHRVRCNKCNQPCIVPAPVEEPVEVLEVVSAGPAPSHSATSEAIYDDDAARQEAIRMAAQSRARTSKKQSHHKDSAGSDSARNKSDRLTIQELIPDILRIPLAVVFGFVASGLVVLLWIICSRATSDALCFMALFVPLGAAGVIRVLVTERGLLIGLLCVAMGVLGIAGGKAAITHFAVIPYFEAAAAEEFLTDLPALLANEKLQLPSSRSIKPYTRDYEFMTCAALVSLVEEKLADPIKVRSWAVHIMKNSNKQSLVEFFDSATSGGITYEPVSIPNLSDTDQTVLDQAYARMGQWSMEEIELQMARKYYPAVNKIIQQAGIINMFKDEKTKYQVAFMNSLGLFDMVWIFLGLGIGYAVTVFD